MIQLYNIVSVTFIYEATSQDAQTECWLGLSKCGGWTKVDPKSINIKSLYLEERLHVQYIGKHPSHGQIGLMAMLPAHYY
jgi:hypothetical protein